jgi:hypothetical protein
MNLPGVVAILITFLVGLVMIAARGWSRRIGAVCLLGSLAAGSFFYLRDCRVASGDEKITLGDSQQRVLALLGSPTKITDCTTGYGGYKRGQFEYISPDCVQEFWYYSFYFPQSFTYSLNGEKKVVHKYVLTSP